MFKLLFLSDLNSIHTKRWVQSIAKRGVEIEVFGLGKPTDDFYDGLENVNIHHAEFTNQYGKSGIDKVKYLTVRKDLKKIAEEFKPDIVHAHYATSYGLLGSLLNHKRFLISVWGEDVFSFPKESKIKKWIFKRNLRKAKAIFSTSKIMAKETIQYTDKAVTVVPFGVDVEIFKKQVVERDPNKVVIGIVKTLEDKYGISYLIEAFNILLKANPKQAFELLIVGRGRKADELKKQVADLGLKESVVFTGAVPHTEVPVYFNKMDVVVVPSVLEGESFGVAAVEASACEKPVVVSNVGGLPEVVIDGETGLICPPRDSVCLAEKIGLLVNDSELRNRLGKKGRENVLKHYVWEQNVDLMMEHYAKALNEKLD
jgi:glycosyltransferase involved in cell wall biosynthesis